MERRTPNVIAAVLSGLLLFVFSCSAFAGLTSVWTNVQVDSGVSDEYIPRSIDVYCGSDVTKQGNIYVAFDAKTDPNPSRIVILDKNGNIITNYTGPINYTALDGNGQPVNLSIPLNQNLKGVAVDPLTGKVVVTVDWWGDQAALCYVLSADLTTMTQQISLDSDGTGPLKNFFRVGGCAISHDGQKLAVYGWRGSTAGTPGGSDIIEPSPGNIGCMLFIRNAGANASDPNDDTWQFEADLMTPGTVYVGLGYYNGVAQPAGLASGLVAPATTVRDIAFDKDGYVYVLQENTVQKWSTTTYKIVDEIGTGLGTTAGAALARWGLDVAEYADPDGAGPLQAKRLMFTGSGGSDGTYADNTPRYTIHAINSKGLRIEKIDLCPTDESGIPNKTGLAVPSNVAFDRINNRLIVAGRNVPGEGETGKALVSSYTYTEPEVLPAGEDTNLGMRITGKVYYKDALGNQIGIPNVKVGAMQWALATSYVTAFDGSSFAATTDASGNYEIRFPYNPGISPDLNLVMDVDAPGYLRTRCMGVAPQYNDIYDFTKDIELIPASVTSLTWTAPALGPSNSANGADRRATAKGLVDYVVRYGGRATLETIYTPTDTVGSQAVKIGNYKEHTSGSRGYGGRDTWLMFDVDDEWLYKAAPGTDLWVTVEYLDTVDASVTAGYDALGVDMDLVSPNLQYYSYGQYWANPVGDVVKYASSATNEWKTATFKMSNVYFGNNMRDRQNDNTLAHTWDWAGYCYPNVTGADFRVSSRVDPLIDRNAEFDASHTGTNYYFPPFAGPDWIKSVTISKVKPTIPNSYNKISEVKGLAAGSNVVLTDKVMTAQWGSNFDGGSIFYVCEYDTTTDTVNRFSGIRVEITPSIQNLMQAIGRRMTISGQIFSDTSGEKFIKATSVSISAAAAKTVTPVAATAKTLASVTANPSLTGVKVKVTGKVTAVDKTAGTYTLTDDSTNNITVKSTAGFGFKYSDYPKVNDYMTVEGIAALDGVAPGTRVVKPFAALTNFGANGGFEAPYPGPTWNPGVMGWEDGWWGNNVSVIIDPTTAHSGNNYLQILYDPSPWGGMPGFAFMCEYFVPSTKYDLSCWVKGTNVTPGNWFYNVEIPSGTYDWKRISTVFEVGPGVINPGYIGFSTNGAPGTICVDDVQLRPLPGYLNWFIAP